MASGANIVGSFSKSKNKSAKLELPDLSDVESMFPVDAVLCRKIIKFIKRLYEMQQRKEDKFQNQSPGIE